MSFIIRYILSCISLKTNKGGHNDVVIFLRGQKNLTLLQIIAQ